MPAFRQASLSPYDAEPDGDVIMSVAKIVSALQFCPDGCVFGARAPRDPAPSLQSRAFNLLLRQLPHKQLLASAEAVQAHVQKLALQPASYEPAGLGRGVEVILTKMGGWPVYYTAPSSGFEDCNHVMFLHGGGYINEIVPAHWRRPSCCGCCWRMRDPQRSRWSAILPARVWGSPHANGCAIADIASPTGWC
jgi:hypothetical protein